jgi:hypothetical protein
MMVFQKPAKPYRSLTPMNNHQCKFPRAVEESPCAQAVRDLFRSGHGFPKIQLDASVTTVLQRALRTTRLKRGFDTALAILANERRGLSKLQKNTGQAQKARVSRLILISSDASERLHREIAGTLERNAPRLLALTLQADSATLGSLLYGPAMLVKVLLLDHKDSVAEMLIAGAQQHIASNSLE